MASYSMVFEHDDFCRRGAPRGTVAGPRMFALAASRTVPHWGCRHREFEVLRTHREGAGAARRPCRQLWHPGPSRMSGCPGGRAGVLPSSVATDGCLQLAVEAFDHTIGCGVVRHGADMSGSCQGVQVPGQERLELPPLVRCDAQWHAEAMYPRLEEGAGHRGSLLVG
jgi:hypothetical protein